MRGEGVCLDFWTPEHLSVHLMGRIAEQLNPVLLAQDRLQIVALAWTADLVIGKMCPPR
jgi:hypothetical protein